MNKRVTLIDYGLSNLLSIHRALINSGAEVSIVTNGHNVGEMDKIVLPGVGAFPDGMKALKERNLVGIIKEHTDRNKPFLGICLGMQMMLNKGMEIEETPGLGIIDGEVIELPRINSSGKFNRIPHVGWETLIKPNEIEWENSPFSDLGKESFVYFVHSYYASVRLKENVLGESYFGELKFTSAIRNKNSFGMQFHPEKSGDTGLRILKNYIEL